MAEFEVDKILCGDCLEIMAGMPSNFVSTVLTDPPYGLSGEPDMAEVLTHWLAGDDYEHRGGGFMGKSWDSFVPGPSVWREVYRVMKPGGALLAFGGTRTNDLLSIAIRLAGFRKFDEIDYYYGGLPPQMAWVTGQGFPKSLDVSKAIDKMAGRIGENVIELKREIRKRFEATRLTLQEFNAACGFEASGYLRETSTWAGVLPSREKWQQIKEVLNCDGLLDALFDEAEREIIGKSNAGLHRGTGSTVSFGIGNDRNEPDITAPATEAAALWSGYGTGLKPAHEVILCFYKPREGTYAHNALRWGVAGLWIDGARIATNEDLQRVQNPTALGQGSGWNSHNNKVGEVFGSTNGRWPANLLLQHADGCRRRGTRRVRGDKRDGSITDTPARSWKNQSVAGIARQGYADPDGYERVDDWECVEGCPVRILGEQSGERPHSWRSDEPKYYGRKGENWFGLGNWRNVGYKDTGTAARFFFQSKASRRERNLGCQDVYWRKDKGAPIGFVRIERDEWEALPEKQRARGNIHPTVKPLGVVEYLCRLTRTPTGGVVFDPFAGTGTTALGAFKTGRHWLCCDNQEDYVYLANLRIEALRAETPQMELSL